MIDNYTILEVFDYSTSSQITKSKLESEGIRVMLMDETTIDADPLISQAIGGVKLLVHNDDLDKAIHIYNEIRTYETSSNGNKIQCPNCGSTRILVAPPQEQKIWLRLFPFFEKKKYICNDCKTISK